MQILLKSFVELLSYPTEQLLPHVGGLIDELMAHLPESRADLEPMREFVKERPPSDVEELFVRTFENNKDRALELGWHLHGENYARGVFMARMRGLLRDHEVAESVQLPDHVTHVLAVMAAAPEGLGRALASSVALPALERIEGGFSAEGNPYRGVVSALRRFIQQHFNAGGAALEEVQTR